MSGNPRQRESIAAALRKHGQGRVAEAVNLEALAARLNCWAVLPEIFALQFARLGYRVDPVVLASAFLPCLVSRKGCREFLLGFVVIEGRATFFDVP